MLNKSCSALLVAASLAGAMSIPARAVDAGQVPASTPLTIQFKDNHQCTIQCVDPHPACEESQKVIELLKEIYAAFGRRDIEAFSQYLDDGCTTFDEDTKSLIVGKKAVLEDVRKKMDKIDDKEAPLVSLTIEHPYAQVHDDTAVVTFTALKEYGGTHPRKLESRCTDIFVKKEGKWRKLHYRSNWKPIT